MDEKRGKGEILIDGKEATQNDAMRCPKYKGELVEMNPEEWKVRNI
jgi:hypothetical protein